MRWTGPAIGPGEVWNQGSKEHKAHQQKVWSPRGQQTIAMQTSRNQHPKAGSQLAALVSAAKPKPRARGKVKRGR